MTSKSFHRVAAILGASLLSMVAQGEGGVASNPVSAAPAPATKADPRAAIVNKINGLKLEDVRITPVSGIYEITRGSEVSYTSSDVATSSSAT